MEKSADIDEASSCRTTLTCSSPSKRNLFLRAPSELTCLRLVVHTKTARKEASSASYVVDSRQRVRLASVAFLEPLTIAHDCKSRPNTSRRYTVFLRASYASVHQGEQEGELVRFARQGARRVSAPGERHDSPTRHVPPCRPHHLALAELWRSRNGLERVDAVRARLAKARREAVRADWRLSSRHLLTVGPAGATNSTRAGSAFAVRTRLSRR